MQIFSNFADIDTDGVSKLMVKSYKAIQIQKGLYFDFMNFNLNHWKTGKIKANEIASQWEFQARFWALMKLVFPMM